jgi:hypothetical protein
MKWLTVKILKDLHFFVEIKSKRKRTRRSERTLGAKKFYFYLRFVPMEQDQKSKPMRVLIHFQ